MAYCTQADILDDIDEAQLIQLTVADAENLSDEEIAARMAEVVAAKIADADAVINSHVVKRYAIPLNPVPAIAKNLSKQIAAYLIYSRVASKVGGAPETIVENYDDAIKMLEKIQEGKADLDADPPPTSSTGTAKVTSAGRMFTKDSMTGF